MINLITSEIKTKLQGLDLVEKIAGLVTPTTIEVEGGQLWTFPISNDVAGQQCFESGKYMDLVPNSDHKSVIYLEEQRPLTNTGYEEKQVMRFETVVRVVCWLNLAKLGVSDGTKTSQVSMTIIDNLLENNGIIPITDPNFTNAKLYLEMDAQAMRNPNIFSRYSYSQFGSHLIYPYDYFAIDFKCKLLVNRACFTAFVAGSVIDCVEV